MRSMYKILPQTTTQMDAFRIGAHTEQIDNFRKKKPKSDRKNKRRRKKSKQVDSIKMKSFLSFFFSLCHQSICKIKKETGQPFFFLFVFVASIVQSQN